MQLRTDRRNLLAGSLGVAVASSPVIHGSAATASTSATVLASAQALPPDWQAVSQALGAAGQLMDGDVFRIGMPRTDLEVSAQGVPLLPGFALGSYAAFKQVGDQTMVMGDLVLLDEEVNPVMSGLFEAGFSISGLHNHLNEITPHVMYMHYMGMGEAVQLATSLREVLSVSGTPLGDVPMGTPAPGATPTASPTTDLPSDQIGQALGRDPRIAKGGIVQFSIPRAETIMEGDIELLPSMGVATVLNFQPVEGGQAAITGDFLMLAEEVNPVAQTLRANGIEVHALHNHHLMEQPRYFYMHFFATGDPVQLAQGLKAAVDKTNSRQG